MHAILPRPARGAAGHAAESPWRLLLRVAAVIVVPIALLGLWDLSTVLLRIFPKALLPSPGQVVETLIQLARTGELFRNIVASLARVLYANVAALALGVPLGLAMGMSQSIHRLLSGLLSILRPIPPLAWVPLAILWFGIGTTSVVFITFLSAFFAVLLNTIAGAHAVDPILLRAAASLGASRTRIVMGVVLPSVLPYIFTGFRIAIGVSWMSIVAAELIAATSGLGYMISFYREVLRTDAVMAGMLTIGIIGLLMDLASRWLERWLLPWRSNAS
jgi:ABC-type nitrate/sulfonate/bicarbonate transport system permease component